MVWEVRSETRWFGWDGWEPEFPYYSKPKRIRECLVGTTILWTLSIVPNLGFCHTPGEGEAEGIGCMGVSSLLSRRISRKIFPLSQFKSSDCFQPSVFPREEALFCSSYFPGKTLSRFEVPTEDFCFTFSSHSKNGDVEFAAQWTNSVIFSPIEVADLLSRCLVQCLTLGGVEKTPINKN